MFNACLFPPSPLPPPPWRIFNTSFIQHCKDPCLLARSKGIIELTSFCLVSSYYRAIHTHKNNNNNILHSIFQTPKTQWRWKKTLKIMFVPIFCFVLLVSNVVVIRNKKDLLMIFFVRKLKDHKKLSAAFLNRVIWHTQQAKRAHNFNILFI